MGFLTNSFLFTIPCLEYSQDFSGCTNLSCDGSIPSSDTSIYWIDSTNNLWRCKVSRGAHEGNSQDFSGTAVGTLDDDNWNLRFPYKVTAQSHSGGGSVWNEFGVGITNYANGLYNGAEKSIFFYQYRANAGAQGLFLVSNYEGATVESSFSNTLSTGTQYYIEIVKESTTLATMNLYSNSGYSTLIETESVAVNSSTVGQNHIKMTKVGTGVYVGSGNIEAQISDFTISNGAVEPC